MGSLYRSEEMCLAQIFLQSEAAYSCVAELGELGLVQFRDLNPDVNAFQRKFVSEVRRCDEMERRLRFFEKEVTSSGISILNTGENPNAPAPREMIDLEACFEKLENELKEVNTNQEALMRNFLELTELKHILQNTQTFFSEGNRPDEAFGFSDMQLGFVTGVIRRERIPAFEQMLWRVCRGNVFLRQAEIEEPLKDPSTGEEVWKSVFIIFFQGDQLKIRVKKICEGFRATLYPCNETAAERAETSMAVLTRLEDLQKVLSQTEEHRQRLLSLASKSLRVWFIKVRKLKAIYHTLNLFNLDVTQKCLIAECWCPVSDLDQINLALRRGTEVSGSSVPSILNRITTDEEPPTYNKTNKFTKVYQSLVDSYGVANYREVNPAPFTIITYPFLFSVMYGDMGHGLIMFLFGLWLVVREKQLHASLANHEMFGMLYGGRYVIMLMGLFSVYSGFLYNDCLSNSVNIFGSTWNATNMNYTDELLSQDISLGLDPKYSATGAVYPIGIDPMWQLSTNSINFLNSYKMKLSVILGVSQMTFGVFLSFCNHRYFKRSLNIWGEFVPQLIFMISIFGYLVVLIFVKWLIYDVWNENSAPSLILTLINMGLLTPPDPPMFPGQPSLQIFLVLLAVSCIPWMLFVKPVVLYLRHQNRPLSTYLTWPNRGTADASGLLSSDTQAVINQDELAINNSDAEDPETSNHLEQPASLVPKEFDFGETFIYQAIHTIEYCLGCISHTASYLRLWALSLAHSELSEVLWNMLLAIGLRMNGFVGSIATFGCFGAWAILTVGILLFMEGLSAFLHTLRLHWIEFQSKFYKGEGHPFLPFTFDAILEGKEE
ncbi:V-type proton ATPase 116 kDa subunit a [Strongylocentrotus purpuratus]|uniref:V-type proton ATPase subunit a n=1 Tax=Strongylocentrotus purpuratus TaxID=7668 RepID=A0A7M7PMT2_STRPU|nr:V-type proton ATPase 116 kDa subunit a [Strongylocentrotus purpuratus]